MIRSFFAPIRAHSWFRLARRLSIVPLLAVAVVAAVVAVLPPPPPAPVLVEDIQPPHVWQPGLLRVGIDASYPPFATFDNGAFRGHDVELAQQLAGHLGRRLELVNVPFDGLYDALRVSRIDVIVSALPYQEELAGAVIYSRPYFQAGEVLIVPTATPARDAKDLTGRRLGAELGSLGDQTARRLRARGDGFALDSSFRSVQAALVAMRGGQLDGVVVDRVTALGLVRSEPDLRILDPPLSDAPYVIALPYDAAEMAREVDAWLGQIERDGTLARLTAKYLG